MTLRRSIGIGRARSRIPPSTIRASRFDKMLRAMPRPAWNCSKCSRPLSAPRRIRNAHFSPISSIAWRQGAAQARRPGKRRCRLGTNSPGRLNAPIASEAVTQAVAKEQLRIATRFGIIGFITQLIAQESSMTRLLTARRPVRRRRSPPPRRAHRPIRPSRSLPPPPSASSPADISWAAAPTPAAARPTRAARWCCARASPSAPAGSKASPSTAARFAAAELDKCNSAARGGTAPALASAN